ncbi:D-alanyl-D-alanine carboxypeptidase/D-alanyl-D-alanine-endopeptidase [Myxococcota bacterium]|nr:D-alanyl-D-alanine carboxypeptidase/D-alanyl-D-alanine-endopeptidase [Myxococcota bacterium]
MNTGTTQKSPAAPLPVPAIALASAMVLTLIFPRPSGPVPDARAADALATGALAPVIEPLIAESKVRRSDLGMMVADLDTGEVLYALDPDRSMNPASCLKLVTAAAALEALGPAFRFKTEFLRRPDAEVADGVLKGDLYVRGSGDPEMVYERLWKAAVDVRSRGVEQVAGNLVLDDSAFDDVREIAGWELDDGDSSESAYNAPISALSANFNAIGVVVAPGGGPGELAHVALETPTRYARILNQAITGRPRTTRTIEIVRRPVAGGVELVVKGSMPAGAPPKVFYRPVVDPTEFFGALFVEFFRQLGGRVEGRVKRGRAPDDAVPVHVAWSPPLSVLVADMDKFSNNFIAEHLVKAMGVQLQGAPGTTEKGLAMSRRVLEAAGVAWEDVRVTNGSGLSRQNRISAAQLCRVIRWAAGRFRTAPEFLSSLAISGVDGTLHSRMGGELLEGRIRGKTGTVNGVASLAGVQEVPGGRRLAFAYMANGVRAPLWEARDLFERIGGALAVALAPAPAPGVVTAGGGDAP